MISNPSGFEGDDLDLLRKFVDHQNSEAIRILFRKYRPTILGICRRYFRCQADADDALQEVFLTLMAHAPSIHSNVGGWLSRSAANICLSMIRSRQSQSRRELEHSRLASHPDEDSQWSLFLSQLPESLDQLDPIDHGILLQNAQGTTQKQIASSLGISQQAVAKRLDKALTRIRHYLTSHVRIASCFAAAFLFAKRTAYAALPQALRSALVPSLGTTSGTLKICTAAAALVTTVAVTCEYAGNLNSTVSPVPLPIASGPSLPLSMAVPQSTPISLIPTSLKPTVPIIPNPAIPGLLSSLKPAPTSSPVFAFGSILPERLSENSAVVARRLPPENLLVTAGPSSPSAPQTTWLPVPSPSRRIVIIHSKSGKFADPVPTDSPDNPTIADDAPPAPAPLEQQPPAASPPPASTPPQTTAADFDPCGPLHSPAFKGHDLAITSGTQSQMPDSTDNPSRPSHFSQWFTGALPSHSTDIAADSGSGDPLDPATVTISADVSNSHDQDGLFPLNLHFFLNNRFLSSADANDFGPSVSVPDVPMPSHWHPIHIGASLSSVPEPSSLLLLSCASLFLLRRKLRS